MAEKFSLHIMEGSSSPMISVRMAKGGKGAPFIQVGKVFVASGKSKEQVAKELTECVVSASPTMTNWFEGKISFKRRLVLKYGETAGLEIYKLINRIESQGRAIATMKQQISLLGAGSVCEQCGTHHSQGKKDLVVEPDGKVFCNFGCKDQFYSNMELMAKFGDVDTSEPVDNGGDGDDVKDP